eukprot:15441172-Alexandrium_andersonii.AAC.1
MGPPTHPRSPVACRRPEDPFRLSHGWGRGSPPGACRKLLETARGCSKQFASLSRTFRCARAPAEEALLKRNVARTGGVLKAE